MCGSVKRVADRGQLVHNDEVVFLTNLIIDLKNQSLGRVPVAAIPMERLEQATKHVWSLLRCRKQGLFK